MRILAIDYGQKRVGLAVSDPTGTLASPLRTVNNFGRPKLLEAMVTAVRETGAARVLVGIPVRTDGTYGEEARRVLEFAHELAARIEVPVTGLNEAFTTAEAHARLRAMSGKKKRDPKKDRAFIDQLAAMLLLEDYLQNVPATPEPLPVPPPPPEPRASEDPSSRSRPSDPGAPEEESDA